MIFQLGLTQLDYPTISYLLEVNNKTRKFDDMEQKQSSGSANETAQEFQKKLKMDIDALDSSNRVKFQGKVRHPSQNRTLERRPCTDLTSSRRPNNVVFISCVSL